MAINPNYETIGKSFVQQYYALFDGDATQRAGLAAFYSVSLIPTSVLDYSRLNLTIVLPTGNQFPHDLRRATNDGS